MDEDALARGAHGTPSGPIRSHVGRLTHLDRPDRCSRPDLGSWQPLPMSTFFILFLLCFPFSLLPRDRGRG